MIAYLIFSLVFALCIAAYGYHKTHDLDNSKAVHDLMLIFGVFASVVLFVVLLFAISWTIPVLLVVGFILYKQAKHN